MFALVLVGALVSQSLSAPSNCGTASVCDPYSGRQIAPGSSQNKGGYSSYSKWGSSSSWASGPVTSGPSSNLETLDEGNVIGTSSLNRPGSWRDEKSYVTDDRKGKIDYKASQEVTGNSYRKSAESSYSWGTNDYNEAKANSQIIHSSQFDGQIRDVERDMEAFMGQFSLSSSSIVNQQTLDSFRRQAERLTSQVTGLCDRADVNSEEYRRLQRIKQNFERQVELKQQEIMNFVIESKHSFTGSITSSSSGGSYVQPQQPQYPTKPVYPEPIYQAPVTVSPVEIERERVQQECNTLRANIESFYRNYVTAQYNTYDREDTLATFRAQVNAQIAAINEQVANLRVQSSNFEYQRNFVEEMNKTFETYVTNLNQHIKDCEERILAEQRRLIEEQERINRERMERERQEVERRYQENKKKMEEQHAREQREFEEQQRIEEARLKQQKIEAELEWQRKKDEAERVTYRPRPQPPSLPQILPPVQTVTPNVDVHQSGGWQHKVDVHVSGSQHHEISGSSFGGNGVTSGQQIQYQPSIGPHIDFTDIQNKMSQEFNRLVSSVNRLSSYSMQLTESNQQTINAQFQHDANELRRKIENLCQESSQYNNDHVFKAAEELKRTLEQSFQYFQQELAKISSSGSFQDNSSWGTSGRFTHVRQPQISNVEFSHKKSTEIELTHGGRGNTGQQQVICVEQYANQPCIEPVRVRREAGGYYSQQHESNLDEYTPRRRSRRRNYEPEAEDYSQQHVDPQLQLDDYSQRTRQVELPRNRQENVRSDSYRRQSHDSQQIEDLRRQEHFSNDHYSQRSHHRRPYGQQETEDLSQQYVESGQNEDLQSYQKPRSQRLEDSSQQHVQSGQSEDLQSYQRPRSQRIQDSSQQYVQSGQSEDLQSYQKARSQRMEELSQQYVQNGQREDLQLYQKPRNERIRNESQQYVQSGQSEDLHSYQRPRSQRTEDSSQQYVQSGQTEDLQLHQKPRWTQEVQAANLQREQSSASTGRTLLDQRLVVDEPQDIVKPIVKPGKLGSTRGVNDYSLENSDFYDNPKLQENSKLNDNLQQSYERPSQTQIIETHGKLSDKIQKPRGSSIGQLTLENSGFDNYQKHNEQYSVTESPTEQVTRFKNLEGFQKLEDLTLQKSGFFENAGQGQNLELMETSASHRNEDLVQNDDRQQSSVQMNLGPEVQPGRQSNFRPERINSYNDDTQLNIVTPAPSTQNREYGQREHPVGQYIHNLPQQNRPSSPNIIDLDSNEPNIQHVNADNQDKILPPEDQQSIVTAYPPVRPAPKPVPRYTRPWQVSQNINVPQRPANDYLEQPENQNTNVESYSSSQNSNEFNKHSEPHRGDLPGHSELTTEEAVYIPPQSTPVPTVRPTNQAPITEEPRQEPVEPEVPTQRTPCLVNRCQNNQFDDLSQTYYYRQQHQQNIRFSQQSTYNNQQNLGISSYQRRNPFYQQNSQVQFNQQVSPVNYTPEYGYTYRYRDQQTNHLSINHQGSTHPTEPIAFEQSDLLGLNGQENSHQQVQKPSFGNSSGQRELSQHHSTFTYNQQSSYSPDEGFPARVIPLDEAQSRNIWADIESTTRPTFWKKVGHKISNAYEKVKESARTVYG